MTKLVAPWRIRSGGIDLAVRLAPGAQKDSVDGAIALAEGRSALAMRVRARLEGGRANSAMIACLAKVLGVPKSAIALTSGPTSRFKRVRITCDPVALAPALENCLNTGADRPDQRNRNKQ